VASGNNNSVQRFNGTNGSFLNTAVTNGAGGINLPIGVVFAADGSLCVASFNSHKVARFNPATGAQLTDAAPVGSGGLNGPNFMIIRPPPAPPTLRLVLQGTNALLTWSNQGGIFRPEQTEQLSPNVDWIDVTNSVVASNNLRSVTLPLEAVQRFFRLVWP
jgi:hypothetical protein